MMTSTDYGALLPRQCAKYKACEDFSVAEWDEVEENAALRRAPATRTRHLAWFADNRRALTRLPENQRKRETKMAKKSIDQIDVAGKTVLMRVDFNVPLDETGKHHRRPTDSHGAAEHQERDRSGRTADPDEPPGSARWQGVRGKIQPRTDRHATG